MRKPDKYLKIVEWSGEGQCYIGRCPDLMFGGIHGTDERKVYSELCDTIEEWISIYKEDGNSLPPTTINKRYSG